MQLALPRESAAKYHSASQRARVATEEWAEENLYCLKCSANSLAPTPRGTPAIDFNCPDCKSPYQLKSLSRRFSYRIRDAAYSAMKQAIQTGNTPNLFVLSYGIDSWRVNDLILVPSFAFTMSAVEKCPPLAATARRAGWIGCNILLGRIPADAKIPIISSGKPESAASARRHLKSLRPFSNLTLKRRGWTLDVLNVVRSLGKKSFTLDEVYVHADELAALHPDNRHVRDKIRQQLQAIRDLKLLRFRGNGEYDLC
ncbi:MAG: DpnI domain-containing protein [Candidatus Acidiferrales bacterium]